MGRIKHNLGIPYMGSKRKLAKDIINHIIIHNPNVRYFYDIFGGGGAISFEAMQRKKFKHVFYNEIDPAIVNLIKHLRDNGITTEMYNWVTREEFHDVKNGTDWWAGFVKTCWSFGNDLDSYIFGEGIENIKKLAHEMIVFKDNEARIKLQDKIKIEISPLLFDIEDLHERRKWFQRLCKKRGDRTDLQQLERLQQLQLSNASYEKVVINTPINETIIYCDPPYEMTAEYQNDINHGHFLDWVKDSPYKIYVSSYNIEGLYTVKEMSHRSTLSATNNNKSVVEVLYCNQQETVKTELF